MTAFSVLAPSVEEEPVAAEAEAAAAGPEVITEKKEEGEAAAAAAPAAKGKGSKGERAKEVIHFRIFDLSDFRIARDVDETVQIRLIAGLGNPGRGVRGHAAQHRIYGRRPAGRAVWIDLGKIGKMGRTLGEMRSCASGQAVELHESQRLPLFAVAQFYKIEPQEILVVLDDFALPLGRLRLRARGGPGGHNGLESVIVQFGTEEIPRLRIGIGAAPREGSVDYVLSRFFDEEKPIVRSTIDRAVEALKCAIDKGLVSAMNTFQQIRRNMKNRYEALLVLNTQAKDETVKEIVERLESEFQKEGAKIEQVQKMDKRHFSYVAGSLDAGYYVNFIFNADPQLIAQTADQIQTRSGRLSPALPAARGEQGEGAKKSGKIEMISL